jgi:putative peptidoglycan lipid II flippase
MTETEPARPPRRKGFVHQSAVSSTAALLAMLAGLLIDVALALRFGAGSKSDAFFVAARIPIGICAVLMTVATQSLVPTFTRARAEGGLVALGSFASKVLTAVLLGGLVLSALASLLAGPLVALTAPGLSAQEQGLARAMVPVMFLVVPLVAAAETVRAALNASFSFVLPAGMNLFMNGLTAAVILVDTDSDIRVVAWAYVAGAAFQLAVVLGAAWRRQIRIALSARLRDERLAQAFRLSGRPTVSSLLNLGNRVVEQLVASFLPTGSITILSYGQRLISALGGGVFFRPVTVALMPRLAEAEHGERTDEVVDLVARALRFVFAISIVLTAFTVALAEPVVRVVFHRGNFSPEATHLLALSLAVYSVSLVGSGVQRVLLAPFYARMDARVPLRNTFYGVLVDLALLGPGIVLFGRHSTRAILGVALAYSLTQYVIVGHAWLRLRRTAPLGLARLIRSVTKTTLTAAFATAGMVAFVRLSGLSSVTDRSLLVILTVAAASIGAIIVAVVGVLLAGRGWRNKLHDELSAG